MVCYFNTTSVFIKQTTVDKTASEQPNFNTTSVFIKLKQQKRAVTKNSISIQLLFLLNPRRNYKLLQFCHFNTTSVFIKQLLVHKEQREILDFNTTSVFIKQKIIKKSPALYEFQYNFCFY